jgi:hypothetical protein
MPAPIPSEAGRREEPFMQASFQTVRGVLQSWQELFDEAAAIASQVGPDHLIGFSHSEDRNEGVITIWYWDDRPLDQPPQHWVRWQVFRGVLTSWRALFEEAGRFAGELGRERLIGMSHSEGHNEGVVTVWYWDL